MYYVYILRSIKNGKPYTGSTGSIVRRLAEHNAGQSKSTRLNRPFELVYKESYTTRSEAVRRELFFKTGKGRELLKRLIDK